MTPPARARTLLLCLACGGCGAVAPAPPPVPSPRAGSRAGFAFDGVTHVSWWHDEYASTEAASSRRDLAATRAGWAGLVATWYMDARDSSSFGPDPDRTPDDAALVQAIREFHALGLKVMLKPHVDVQDGTWRGTIAPRDTTSWFQAYDDFLAHYADLAAAQGVEMLCVGTELATITDEKYAAAWAGVLGRVRGRYHGLLTYAANAVVPADEFTSVSFWGLLDVVGLDAYTPLTAHDDPAVAELVSGWSSNRDGDDMVAAFQNLGASLGKPVIFTELGYRSARGTNQAPWDYSVAAPYDPGEQANCYEAAFEVWSGKPFMKGIFWWDWAVPPPGAEDTDYTPRTKPAQSVLSSWLAP